MTTWEKLEEKCAWKWLLTPQFQHLINTVESSTRCPAPLHNVVNFTRIIVQSEEIRGLILVDRPEESWNWGVPFLETNKTVATAFRDKIRLSKHDDYVKFLRQRKILPIYLSFTRGSSIVECEKHTAVWIEFTTELFVKLASEAKYHPVSVLTWNNQAFHYVDPLKSKLENKAVWFETNCYGQRFRDSFDWFLNSLEVKL